MHIKKCFLKSLAGTVLAVSIMSVAHAGDLSDNSNAEVMPPFSGPANVAYAQEIWGALAKVNLVGPESLVSHPYFGNPPHGGVLEYFEQEMTIDGVTGAMLVKKNYRGETGEDEALAAVLNDRLGQIDSVTVMFQREDGYDPEHKNWFWAKYLPDGTLDKNPKGMELAGRVAKGADVGCIACHVAAPGDDLVFTHEVLAK
jgi:hypothetical protein